MNLGGRTKKMQSAEIPKMCMQKLSMEKSRYINYFTCLPFNTTINHKWERDEINHMSKNEIRRTNHVGGINAVYCGNPTPPKVSKYIK